LGLISYLNLSNNTHTACGVCCCAHQIKKWGFYASVDKTKCLSQIQYAIRINEPLITAYDGQKQTKLSTLTSNSIYNNSQSILSNCSTISVSNPNPNLYRRSYIYPTLNNLVTDFAIDGIQCSCGCLDSLHGELMQAAGTLERDK
jgi:hypothetical protein